MLASRVEDVLRPTGGQRRRSDNGPQLRVSAPEAWKGTRKNLYLSVELPGRVGKRQTYSFPRLSRPDQELVIKGLLVLKKRTFKDIPLTPR